jgi:hypothetical protein
VHTFVTLLAEGPNSQKQDEKVAAWGEERPNA